MGDLILVDTSILLNLLSVPNCDQDRAKVKEEFLEFTNVQASIFLPLAAIVETGNHIAHIGDGAVRRTCARRFVGMIQEAKDGTLPWKLTTTRFPEVLENWLKHFPDEVITGKGIGDLSILLEWEELCTKYPHRRVRIWTVDGEDLAGYDRVPDSSLSLS